MTNTLTAKDDLSFLCVCDDVTQVSRVLEALHFKMPGTTAKRVQPFVSRFSRNSV
jgi:hypothetical protein